MICASVISAKGCGFDPPGASAVGQALRLWRLSPIRGNFRGRENSLDASASSSGAFSRSFSLANADDLIAQLAVLEKKAAGLIARMLYLAERLWFSSTFTFAILQCAGFFPRYLVQQRRDHFARTAPFRPKIDDHRFVVLRKFAVKIRFVKCDSGRIFHS